MRAQSLRLLLIAGALVALVSCVSWIGRYGPPFQENADPNYFSDLIAQAQRMVNADGGAPGDGGPAEPTMAWLEPVFSSMKPAEQNPGDGYPSLAPGTACESQPVLLRFSWLSDVQLRQGEVKLGNAELSRALNTVINTFEFDPVAEEFDWSVYLAHVLSINRYQRELRRANETPLSFMIHTGDSIDSGTIEELYQYIFISNELEIPWFNVLGNHDTAVFGNYEKSKNYSLAADVEFYPIARRPSWLAMHKNGRRALGGFGHFLYPIPEHLGGKGHTPSLNGSIGTILDQLAVVPPSECHGFDLHPDSPCHDVPECDQQPGYYAFDLDGVAKTNTWLQNAAIRVIVLDSPKKKVGDWGEWADIGQEETDWLRGVLASAGDRLLLVFAHHRPGDYSSDVLKVLHDYAHGNMIFFTGHTHQNHIAYLKGAKPGQGFYDLNNGAVMQYPQTGRIVEVRGTPGQVGCIVSKWMWPSYLDLPQDDKDDPKALTPAQETRWQECLDDRMLIRNNLAEAAGCGHLGALRDYVSGAAPIWGAPQDINEGRRAANVIVPIRIPALKPAQSVARCGQPK
jgi:predicted phosphodiesterase